jgi:ubiquinone/menaquinone biosynthesis C-methylase UbiE
LGCGNKVIPGFVNVDARSGNGLDVVEGDVANLTQFPDGSAELIYASHVLEHFQRAQVRQVLRRWFELLAPGGTLRLAVPDFTAVCDQYRKGTPLKSLMGFLHGGQTYKENFHYVSFDHASLKIELEAVGFVDVRPWDWRLTEQSHIDDFS